MENIDPTVVIAFTICSNNYLAQAKTLKDSLFKHNPEVRFFIALADIKSQEVDYDFFAPATVIELDHEIIPGYENMISRYDIVELNTAVKPFFFKYLIAHYSEARVIYYFDPDIFIYNSLHYLNALLYANNIVLTPHFCTPIPVDGLLPFETLATRSGIYNLGFIGLNPKSSEALKFLDWWGERTFNFGYCRLGDGLFVDQLWINLVPVFFKGVYISFNKGCNMAPWNLHERWIVKFEPDKKIVLNDEEELIFFHFSTFNPDRPFDLSEAYNRYSLENIPFVKMLYELYHKSMVENKVQQFGKLKCALPIAVAKPALKHRIAGPVLFLLRRIWQRI